jgi:hypothetical protein
VDSDGRYEVSAAREWIGSRETPLRPREVLAEVADIVRRYDCMHRVYSDQASFDSLQDSARAVGVTLIEAGWTAGTERTAVYTRMRDAFSRDGVALPVDAAHLAADLGGIRRRLTHQGATIVLPLTPDGRHCDYAPAIAMLFERLRYAGGPEPARTPDDEDEAMFALQPTGDPWDDVLS